MSHSVVVSGEGGGMKEVREVSENFMEEKAGNEEDSAASTPVCLCVMYTLITDGTRHEISNSYFHDYPAMTCLCASHIADG